MPGIAERLIEQRLGKNYKPPAPGGLAFGLLQQRMGGGAPLPSNNPYESIFNYEQRLLRSGQEPPAPENKAKKNLLFTALDYRDRPRNAVVTGLKHVFDNDPKTTFVGGAKRGFTGQEKTYFSELLPQADTKLGKAARFAGGFVGDVILDPFTWTGVGAAGSVSKSLGSAYVRNVVKGLAKKGVIKDVGRVADDIARITGKPKGANVDHIDDFVKPLNEQQSIIEQTSKELTDLRKQRNKALQVKKLTNDVNSMNPEQRLDMLNKLDNTLSGAKPVEYIHPLDGVITGANWSGLAKLIKKAKETPFDQFNLGNPEIQKLMNKRAIDTLQRIGFKNFDDAWSELWTFANKTTDEDFIKRVFPGIEKDYDSMMSAIKLSPEQIEAAKVMEEALGTQVSRIKILDNIGKKDLASRVQKAKGIVEQEVEAWTKRNAAHAEIEYINGLAEVVDAANRVKYVKFMGLPMFEISSKLAPVAKLGQAAYANSRIVSTVWDGLNGLVNPHYIKLSEKLADPEKYKQLKRAEETVTRYLRKETGVPYNALYNASKLFDKQILMSDKLRTAVTYWVERNAPDAINTGTGRKYAEEAWEQIANTLSQGELKAVEKAGKAVEHYLSALAKFDEDLGIVYEKRGYYLPHFYKRDDGHVAIQYQRSSKQRTESRISHELQEAKERLLPTLAFAKAHGKEPIEDILTILALRNMDSQRIGLNKELTNALLGLKGVVAEKGSKVPRGEPWQEIMIKSFSKLQAHPEVVRQLRRLDQLFVSDEAYNNALHYFDKLTNMIKTLQTSANPAFLLRNLVGESLLNWMADVGIGAHAKSIQIMQAFSKSKVVRVGDEIILNGRSFAKIDKDGVWLTGAENGIPRMHTFTNNREEAEQALRELLVKNGGEQLFDIGGQKMLAYEVMQMFRDHGLGWSGISKGDLVDNMQDTVKRNIKVGLKKSRWLIPWEGGAELGDFTESWIRLSHMIDRLDKGWSARHAVNDVRKFHVDYRDLTPVERNMFRRIAPYYTYMRKNTPIQLRLLVEKPGWFGAIGRLVNQSYEALGINPDQQMPEYLQRGLAIALGKDENGNVRYFNWNLPLTDIGRIQYDLSDFLQENVVEMAHPAVKAIFELPQNRSFGLGMPIERFEGEQKELIPGSGINIPSKVDYAIQQLGWVNTTRKVVGEAFFPGGKKEPEPFEEVFRPKQPPLFDGVLPAAIGTPASHYFSSIVPVKSPRYASDTRAYQYRDQLQEYIKKLEQDGTPVMSQEQYSEATKYAGRTATASKFYHQPRYKTPYYDPILAALKDQRDAVITSTGKPPRRIKTPTTVTSQFGMW